MTDGYTSENALRDLAEIAVANRQYSDVVDALDQVGRLVLALTQERDELREKLNATQGQAIELAQLGESLAEQLAEARRERDSVMGPPLLAYLKRSLLPGVCPQEGCGEQCFRVPDGAFCAAGHESPE